MYQEVVRPVLFGAGHVVQVVAFPKQDKFETVPANLSRDEIRELVRELLG